MIEALVLAAGKSTRMGAQKLVLPLAGTTVIGHVVDQLCASRVDRVTVVLGFDAQAVAAALCERPVSLTTNPRPEAGMLSSVRCGLKALSAECRTILVVLGDQPALTSRLVDDLICALEASTKSIGVPVFAGRRGHPLLFAAHYRDEVLNKFDEVGLRGLLRDHLDEVLEVDLDDASVLADMDSPADYQRELARLAERPVRS